MVVVGFLEVAASPGFSLIECAGALLHLSFLASTDVFIDGSVNSSAILTGLVSKSPNIGVVKGLSLLSLSVFLGIVTSADLVLVENAEALVLAFFMLPSDVFLDGPID